MLSRLGFYPVPPQPLAALPDGLSVTRVCNTGLTVLDNFCTAEEAEHFINIGRGVVTRSVIVDDSNKHVQHSGRTSQDAFVKLDKNDPVLHRVVFRAASLFGLPCSYAEKVSFTRYGDGEYYKAHLDYNDSFTADRLYTCLIYLNTLTEAEGGGTWFTRLNLVATPKLGRAVCWVNKDPDGTRHPESHHAALPPKGGDVEKWVIQLWFRSYPVNSDVLEPKATAAPQGQALSGSDQLPDGVLLAEGLTEENAYGGN